MQQFFMNLLYAKCHKNPFSSSTVVAWKQTDGHKDGAIEIGTAQVRQKRL
jgi:hypothetical protein